jgi:hypothetical protein
MVLFIILVDMKLLTYIFLLAISFVFAASSEYGERQELGKITDSRLGELSGIVAGRLNPDIFWVHNDSGDEARIFAIDKKAELIGELKINGAQNYDYEDIGIGPGPVAGASYIYIGDFGDNEAVRKHITIYRIPEPQIDSFGKAPFIGQSAKADVINLKYSDGARDAEAMFVDPANGDIYVISKREKNVRAYRAAYPQSTTDTITLEYLLELPFGSLGIPNNGVTGADISSDGSEILIKTYMNVYYFYRENGESISDALNKPPVTLKYTIEPQGEGICWDATSIGYYTISEFGTGTEAYLYFYPKLPNSVKKNDEQEYIQIVQNENEIIVNSVQNGITPLIISVYDIVGRLIKTEKCYDGNCSIEKAVLGWGIFFLEVRFKNLIYCYTLSG